MAMKTLLLVLACVFCNVLAQLLIKTGASAHGDSLAKNAVDARAWFSLFCSPPVLGGVSLWVVSTLIWIYLLSQVELSYAFALYSLNYVLTPLAARWFLNESMVTLQYVGVAIITLGVGVTISARHIGEVNG